MPIWSDYLTFAGSAMGVTSTEAGVILSLLFTSLFTIMALILTGKNKTAQTIAMPLGALLGIIFFTYLGWFPLWTGSLIGLILAIYVGRIVSGGI